MGKIKKEMENTIENKAKFFAQYWGAETECTSHDGGTYKGTVDEVGITGEFLSGGKVLLKGLSAISDEDAKILSCHLVNIVGLDGFVKKQSAQLVKEVIENYSKVNSLFMLPAIFVDKCRELGYAICWNDTTVDDQIEYGWVRLMNNDEETRI